MLLCLEEIHAGGNPSAKLGMLYIISGFPQKIKALTQINFKKDWKYAYKGIFPLQGYFNENWSSDLTYPAFFFLFLNDSASVSNWQCCIFVRMLQIF